MFKKPELPSSPLKKHYNDLRSVILSYSISVMGFSLSSALALIRSDQFKCEDVDWERMGGQELSVMRLRLVQHQRSRPRSLPTDLLQYASYVHEHFDS